jgi:hypothetical protein
LQKYTDSIVNDEWSAMAKGEPNQATADALMDLRQGISLLAPKSAIQQMTRVEIGSTLGQLSDLRQARLAASRDQLPGYLWQALMFAITLLIILGWLQAPLAHMITYSGGVTIGVSVLLTILIQAGDRYVGVSRITAEVISKALN